VVRLLAVLPGGGVSNTVKFTTGELPILKFQFKTTLVAVGVPAVKVKLLIGGVAVVKPVITVNVLEANLLVVLLFCAVTLN
jgi:hypothetical protein